MECHFLRNYSIFPITGDEYYSQKILVQVHKKSPVGRQGFEKPGKILCSFYIYSFFPLLILGQLKRNLVVVVDLVN